MSWNGTWRNQYGSVVVLDVSAEGSVTGTFQTVLKESSFFGLTVPIHGAAQGDVIGFTSAAEGPAGPAAVSYTGILRDGRLEMLWHMVCGHSLTADAVGAAAELKQIGTWRAFSTSLDTFERVG